MSSDKQEIKNSLKSSPFYTLNNDNYSVINGFLSLLDLGKLKQVNKFFAELVYQVLFFTERTKTFILEVFHRSVRSTFGKSNSPLPKTQVFFRTQIHQAPEKIKLSEIDLSGIDLHRINYNTFPKSNFILDNISYNGVNFYPTTLLNKLLLSVVTNQTWIKYMDIQGIVSKMFSKKNLKIDVPASHFIGYSILHRLNALPIKTEPENTLECHQNKIIINDKTMLIIGIGFSDPANLAEMKNKLSKLDSSCIVFEEGMLEELQEKYGDNHFSIGLHFEDAMTFFLINPIYMALYLLSTPECFAEEDFEKSCEILLTEIEKFGDFSNLLTGLPVGLNELKSRLSSVKEYKRLFIEKQAQASSNHAKSTYEYINDILKQMQPEVEADQQVNKSYMQKACRALRSMVAIKTIEESFKTNFYNKAACQAIFKQVINSPDLNTDQMSALFNRFKEREELNRHRNPKIDTLFGIRNTTSWRATWKEIRDNAKQKLFNETDHFRARGNLVQAFDKLVGTKFQPLFCEHRNNTIFKGAFGHTQARKDINAKILEIHPRMGVLGTSVERQILITQEFANAVSQRRSSGTQ